MPLTDASRDRLINSALNVFVDITGLVPGLSEVEAGLRIAADLAPVLETALEYFQSPEGQRAIAHMKALAEGVQKALGPKVTYTPVHVSRPGYKYVRWDALEGPVYQKEPT